jgi:cytochrome b pre-mRNA-processing protein 3
MALRAFLRRKSEAARRRRTAEAIYRRLAAHARGPEFYAAGGVPDTLDGRFEMVVLHAFLVIKRLQREGEAGRALAQALFDVLFADFDRALRELGVGDLGVGRRIRAMAEAFYGRVAAYEAGLAGADEGILRAALRRNLFGTVEPDEDTLKRMAAYLRREDSALGRVPGEAVLAGDFAFGPPPAPQAAPSGPSH